MFSSAEGRLQNRDELYAILQSQFESPDLAELRRLFTRYDINWRLLPPLAEAAVYPQMREAKAIVNLEHPSHGKVETVNSPLFVAGSEKRKPRGGPDIGAPTREVVSEVGYSKDAIDKLIASGAAPAPTW